MNTVQKNQARSFGRTLAASAATLVTAVALVGGMSACSFGTDPKVDKAQVEQLAKTAIKDKTGVEPEKVDCPGDIQGEVGKTMKCTITHQGTTLPLDVKVNSVDGKDVRLGFEVGQPTAPTNS